MSGKAVVAVALVLAGTGAAAAAAAPTAHVAKTKTVKVADNFYSPKKLTVAKGTTVKWKWSNRNADTHDVYLYKQPKGVKHFQSAPAATFFSYKRKLRKAGTYKILCTFHEGMKMRITVTR